MEYLTSARRPWNKGKIVRHKLPLKPAEIWAIRVGLELSNRTRDLALFNLVIDSKLRGCDLVMLRVADVVHGTMVQNRATVMQHKTHVCVQFEITAQTRQAVRAWLERVRFAHSDFIFPGRKSGSPHFSTRQHARLVSGWVASVGLDRADYGTRSLRWTKATRIFRKTRNLRAVQLLLGHRKMESAVRYLGVEVEDALEIAEQIDI